MGDNGFGMAGLTSGVANAGEAALVIMGVLVEAGVSPGTSGVVTAAPADVRVGLTSGCIAGNMAGCVGVGVVGGIPTIGV